MKTEREKPAAVGRKHVRAASAASPALAKRRPVAQKPVAAKPSEAPGPHWTFLTNHAHVLVILSQNPSLVLREVALQVGITERAVQRIIADLEAGGIIEREKIGRQNRYRILEDQPLRHPIESHRTIGELLAVLNLVDGGQVDA